MLLHINENFTIGKLKSSFLSLFFFLTAPKDQLLCVSQGMKQTYLYLWCHLFQVKCYRYD